MHAIASTSLVLKPVVNVYDNYLCLWVKKNTLELNYPCVPLCSLTIILLW